MKQKPTAPDSQFVGQDSPRKGNIKMNRRDLVLDLLHNGSTSRYVPAAFFMHFDSAHHQGQAAIDRHLEFFRQTGMDFVKIQYEGGFPACPPIRRAEDWKHVPLVT